MIEKLDYIFEQLYVRSLGFFIRFQNAKQAGSKLENKKKTLDKCACKMRIEHLFLGYLNHRRKKDIDWTSILAKESINMCIQGVLVKFESRSHHSSSNCQQENQENRCVSYALHGEKLSVTNWKGSH